MRFFMLFAEGVIPPPSDGLPRPCPLSCQQGPVKLGIHYNQKKLAVLTFKPFSCSGLASFSRSNLLKIGSGPHGELLRLLGEQH